MMKVTELVDYCHDLLNCDLYRDYCYNGLQVSGKPEIEHIVTGVTACQALIDKAINRGADAILVHHGLMWQGEPLRIVGSKRNRLASVMSSNLNVLGYHLPLDAHPEFGNNVQLGNKLGLRVLGGLEPGLSNPIGVIGELSQGVSGKGFAKRIEEALERSPLHIEGRAKKIQTIAWVTGGGQRYIDYAIDKGVDAFLTGEVSEQTVHAARESGCHFFAAGHHATERYGVQALGAHLAERFSITHEFIDIDNPA